MEHPPPTVATVKFLYAHALRCAHPGCQEPLYRDDGLSGSWTLNSRICHICARSEGGPRWNPEQTAEENRADGNLLLMCTTHAAAIDDPKALSAYPVAILRQWKTDQVEEHRRKLEGWPLTTAMAEEALAVSFFNVSVGINNSALHLGGEGGRGPGSGGGGGGAIGLGARAGRGGDGGRFTDLDGKLLAENDLAHFLAGVSGDTPPGAGGAGGGQRGCEQ